MNGDLHDAFRNDAALSSHDPRWFELVFRVAISVVGLLGAVALPAMLTRNRAVVIVPGVVEVFSFVFGPIVFGYFTISQVRGLRMRLRGVPPEALPLWARLEPSLPGCVILLLACATAFLGGVIDAFQQGMGAFLSLSFLLVGACGSMFSLCGLLWAVELRQARAANPVRTARRSDTGIVQ